MARQKLSPKTLLARQREARAFRLRLAGATFAEIADELDYRWPSSAWAAVRRYLKRLGPPPEAEEMRQLQVERLRRLLMAAWAPATARQPDFAAVREAVRIIKEISALLGLYVPRRVEADITLREAEPFGGKSINEIYEIARAASTLEALSEEDREWLANLSHKGRAGGDVPDTTRD